MGEPTVLISLTQRELMLAALATKRMSEMLQAQYDGSNSEKVVIRRYKTLAERLDTYVDTENV